MDFFLGGEGGNRKKGGRLSDELLRYPVTLMPRIGFGLYRDSSSTRGRFI